MGASMRTDRKRGATMNIKTLFKGSPTIDQIAVILAVGTLVGGIIFATPAGYLSPDKSLFFEHQNVRLFFAAFSVAAGILKLIGICRKHNGFKKAGISMIGTVWGALFSIIVHREMIMDFYPQSLITTAIVLAIGFTIAIRGDYK